MNNEVCDAGSPDGKYPFFGPARVHVEAVDEAMEDEATVVLGNIGHLRALVDELEKYFSDRARGACRVSRQAR